MSVTLAMFTNADLARLKKKATDAIAASDVIRKARSPMEVTLGHSMAFDAFLQEATPQRVVELVTALQKARGRITELEAEKTDAAFEKTIAEGPPRG